MCGTWLILLYEYFNLRCSKLHVKDIVGKMLGTEDTHTHTHIYIYIYIYIKGNTTEQVKLCDKEVLSDCKNG
jgi:hypothetical protein